MALEFEWDPAKAARTWAKHGGTRGRVRARGAGVQLATVERAPGSYAVAADDIRRAPLRRFPYVVYFVVLARGVSVIAVMHGRRPPAPLAIAALRAQRSAAVDEQAAATAWPR